MPEPTWTVIARRQSGVISRAQLEASGLSRSAVGRMVDRGHLYRLCRGVYLVRGSPLTHRGRLWAAILATVGVIGFASAAHEWDMIRQRPPQVHVIVEPARTLAVPAWIRLHRVRIDGAVAQASDRLPVTSRAVTLLDYLPTLEVAQAMTLADRAVQVGWLTRGDLERRLAEAPGRAGNVALRRIGDRIGDRAAAQSERIMHRLLRRAGIGGWTANHPVQVGSRLIAVVDLAFPARRLAIEIDGLAHHIKPERFQRDRTRQNDLVNAGWTVLRFTWADLTDRPDYVIATVRRALK